MSRGTSEAFFDVVEWAADQDWSTGKVGLLGISYFAGSQWRVAARRPKGLSCIIPWEGIPCKAYILIHPGMSDYYRDRVRHGGILSNNFISFWWNKQVLSYQYGLAGRSNPRPGLVSVPSNQWGEETIEGSLSAEELKANRQDQTIDTAKYKFRDEEYYQSKEYCLEDIEVPVLSVANWVALFITRTDTEGGILLHLRGNIQGYLRAGSKFKYLRAIVGRHDLPFYYPDEVELQRSFLDAFLKNHDRVGWSVPGKVPPVDIVLRKGNVGFNDAKKEQTFSRRTENEWPIARTQYTKYYLTPDRNMSTTFQENEGIVTWDVPTYVLNVRC
jgi:putative CocE/NonD family hydrolase